MNKQILEKNKYYFDFEPIINLAKHFNIDYSFFTNNYSKEEISQVTLPLLSTKEHLKNTEISKKIKKFITDCKKAILDKNLTEKDIEVLNKAYKYLSKEDKLEKADIAIIWNIHWDNIDMKKVAKLYIQGYVKKIFIFGPNNENVKEMKKRYNELIKGGVPKEKTFSCIQSCSHELFKNIIQIYKEQKVKLKSVILICDQFELQTNTASLQKFANNKLKIIKQSKEYIENKHVNNDWYKKDWVLELNFLDQYIISKLYLNKNLY